jgi:hypothetical protein
MARKTPESETPADPMLRLANVLAIYVFKDAPTEDAALRLDKLGFSAREIAGVLGVNDNYIHMVKNALKKNSKKKRRAKT